jgi:predicted nucleic acid-binding protein
MRIVIDSNILFSALIKDSTTRKLIMEYDGVFLFPSFIFKETEKHKEMLLKKSGMDKEEFDKFLAIILQKVYVVPEEALMRHRKEALELTKKIDINDSLFFACALAYADSAIWSNDRRLKNQSSVKVLNTSEIKKLIE